jgi:hypothetical protein
MPTSPKNLIRDPLIGGDGTTSYGQFRAFLVGGPDLPLRRTFRSVSPVGGAASIEELRGLPADAGTSTSLRVMSSFHGGSGAFDAAIWLSPGDLAGAPVSFASVASSITVTLLGSDGVSKATLVAGPPQQFGGRAWVQFTTASPGAFPTGGWLTVTLTNFKLTLQLAAPEVTTSSLGPKAHRPSPVISDEDDRRALRQAAEIDARSPDGPPYREADDR